MQPLGEFLDLLGLFQTVERKYVTIAVLQLFLKSLRKRDEVSGILQRTLIVGLEDFLVLGFAVGKLTVGFFPWRENGGRHVLRQQCSKAH